MRMRTTVFLAALLGICLWAAPAQARLVYVKNPGGLEPVVFAASDNGKDPRRLGIGRAPTISPNGDWVAFVTVPGAQSHMDTVVLQKLGGGSQRLVMRSKTISSLRFSPDSGKLAAIAAGARVRVYDIAADELHVAAEGNIRGYSFSPDSRKIVFGRAERESFQSSSDLFTVPALGGSKPRRITDIGRALNPVWGPKVILFDHFRRRSGDAPAYNLWTLDPGDDNATSAHEAQHPGAGQRARAARLLGRRAKPAGRLRRPGRRGRLHRADAERQDARDVDGLRARDRRLRPVRGRPHDPRPHRRPGSAGRARRDRCRSAAATRR